MMSQNDDFYKFANFQSTVCPLVKTCVVSMVTDSGQVEILVNKKKQNKKRYTNHKSQQRQQR